MLPLSDGIPARRFPIVNVLLIVANFAVFTFYELPHLNMQHPGRQCRSTAQPCGILAATGEAGCLSRTCAPALDRI